MKISSRLWAAMERLAGWLVRKPLWVSIAIPVVPFVAWLCLARLVPTNFRFWTLLYCWLSTYVLAIVIVGALSRRAYKRLVLRQDISLEYIRALKWDDFQAFVGQLYSMKGYTAEQVGLDAPDGGVDLVLHRDGLRTFVQCKHHGNEPVGVKAVRELYGVMAREKASGAIFVTSGIFSDSVVEEFAGETRMALVSGADLLALIDEVRENLSSVSAVEQSRLLEITTRLVDTVRERQNRWIQVPNCPVCRAPMVLRPNTGSDRFWGCSRFPETTCNGMKRLTDKERDALSPGSKKPS